VTSLRHLAVKLDPDERAVLVHLDGTLDRDALLARAGLADPASLEAALAGLASHALLVC
jgi:hypothetical protein